MFRPTVRDSGGVGVGLGFSLDYGCGSTCRPSLVRFPISMISAGSASVAIAKVALPLVLCVVNSGTVN